MTTCRNSDFQFNRKFVDESAALLVKWRNEISRLMTSDVQFWPRAPDKPGILFWAVNYAIWLDSSSYKKGQSKYYYRRYIKILLLNINKKINLILFELRVWMLFNFYRSLFLFSFSVLLQAVSLVIYLTRRLAMVIFRKHRSDKLLEDVYYYINCIFTN